MHAEDARARLVDRHLAHRGEHLLLRARDQRRQIGGDAALEQRGAGAPVAVGVGVEEVDAAEAVHLQVDEAGNREPASAAAAEADAARSARRPPRRPPAAAGRRRVRLRLRVSSRQSMSGPAALVNTSWRVFRQNGLVRAELVYTISNPMAEIRLAGVTKMFGGVTAVDDVSLRDRRRRVPRPRRPVGLRQVDAAAHDRRARGRHRRRDLHRRPRRHRPRAAQPRRRDGLPDLRALPAHVGPPEHGLRAEGPADAEGGDRHPGRRGRRAARPRRSSSTGARRSSPAASASASRWGARSSGSRRRSCSTSRSRTSTRSCASGCARRSRSCTSGSA